MWAKWGGCHPGARQRALGVGEPPFTLPVEERSDATFQENRKSQEFNTIIPSNRLVLSLRHPESGTSQAKSPSSLSHSLSQTLGPLRKWKGNRERKEGREGGRLFAVIPGLDGSGPQGTTEAKPAQDEGAELGFSSRDTGMALSLWPASKPDWTLGPEKVSMPSADREQERADWSTLEGRR